MNGSQSSRKRQRGNILIATTLALPVFIAPLVGMGIDATLCYIVQTELSAAVDGAALGAGRLLSTNANPTDIATEYLHANFRVGQAGFWGAYNLTPTINVQTGTTKTVTVTASVTIPLIFMRLIGQTTRAVAATATATRRDARMVFVIDRSGSMNTSDGHSSTVIADLVQYAQAFTQQFTESYDELGLVVFGSSAVVGYPTTPWPASLSPTGSGGPDGNFMSGSSTDMVHQIAAITAGGGTGMGEGLALAYIELQKAHMRDLIATGADTKYNAIVLFTDGVPSSVATYLNKNGSSVIKTTVGCTYQQDDLAVDHPMYGAVVQASSHSGAPPYSAAEGFYQLASLYSTDSSAFWMNHPQDDLNISPPSVPGNTGGCSSFGWSALGNLSAIPSADKFGYNLGPNTATGVNGYRLSNIVGDSYATSMYNGTEWNTSSATSAYQWGLASWDEVDNTAEAIRADANYPNRAGDTAGNMKIAIYTVGYSGNGGTDNGLLRKIANVNGCNVNGNNCYNDNELAGLYVEASDPTQLANAFVTIASAILRLAH